MSLAAKAHWERELKEAVLENRADLIKVLVSEYGVDVNCVVPASLEKTILFVGVIQARFDAVKCLLELGADPNIADMYGSTPLQTAKKSNLEQFVSVLEAYGAK